jgi:hypothetical protein
MMTNGQALEQSFKTHRIIVRDWTCDVAMSEANAYGYWTNKLHRDERDPHHDDSTLVFRKKAVYEDMLVLASTGDFDFSVAHVNAVFNGATAPAGGGAAATPLTPTAPISPAKPAGFRGKRCLPVTPVVLGDVAHRLKMVPAGHYNKLEAAGADGIRFAQVPPTNIGQYPQYRCSFTGCKKKIRTYCVCETTEIGGSKTIYCDTHFAAHAASTIDL